jgi:acyl CoA:acetate/3-ketoacid CoA transferase beta subunit
MTLDFTLDELVIVACAEAWRGDGEILASPIGVIPSLGAKLARLTFSPDLLMTDGVASLVDASKSVESYMPYRSIFDVVWSGKRHVMMGASQIDRFGNQNIAMIGDDWKKPKAQLLGVRGAPGNTINHTTSYFIPAHTPRSFVPRVDFVSGIGYDRAKSLGPAARFHEIRRVVTNLAVLDFETPDHAMRVRSLHPGVTVEQIVAQTGFQLIVPNDLATTRAPSEEEIHLIRTVLDPGGIAKKEIKS